ncbi:AraC family transcriptional regulator [Streptomyces durbertensis]|uniref:AraC family transcriptional regulator n=1 Tax=Streptomyces durbertensis TaxID=2448886 RepID=A0ABR6ECU8_9ACTN|nr:helix-turn-helix domain-containing protein [Streptomyces durbertensis]MBB1243153.1 AraC family transcriptional regulator [Streptomyces durbertensis]
MEPPSTDASVGEWARHWQDARLPGIDLLRAHYVRQTFPRHAHEGYTLGAVTGGVEEVGLPGGVERVGGGGLVMINPEVAHTARAGAPQGWTYATLYPTTGLVDEIAAETTTLRGTPAFTEQTVVDPRSCRLVDAVHQAIEAGNALAADSLLRTVLALLLNRHGGVLPTRPIRSAGALRADAARRILTERLADPPTLAELAEELGTSPFALSRAFRDRHGQPPHGWLTDARVRRARRLLEAGTPPAEAATAVGFTDQAHLGRHFRRIVGVPPGAYQRERLPHGGARTYKTRTTPAP